MPCGKKGQGIIYEGKAAEEYKHMKNKWIRLAVVSSMLPLVIAGLVSFFNDTFSWLELWQNGEIIMSLFSLNLPLLFDLFEIKRKQDEKLSNAFWSCILVVCFQLVIYCMVRTCEVGIGKLVVVSVVVSIMSWACCLFCVEVMFAYSTINRGGDESGN